MAGEAGKGGDKTKDRKAWDESPLWKNLERDKKIKQYGSSITLNEDEIKIAVANEMKRLSTATESSKVRLKELGITLT